MKLAMTSDEYTKCGGGICPYCQSPDLVGKSFDCDSNCVTQEISCSNCGSSWFDEYTLVGYAHFEGPLK